MNWHVSREDLDLIVKVAERFERLSIQHHGSAPARKELLMDLMACHANGNPLNLAGLLIAENADFAHDVGGIRRHIDRETGELRDCFVPRLSA